MVLVEKKLPESSCKYQFPSVETIYQQPSEFDIKKGDILIFVNRKYKHQKIITVEEVKISDVDGIEIIYDLKRNWYFNYSMYLKGTSNVSALFRVKLC